MCTIPAGCEDRGMSIQSDSERRRRIARIAFALIEDEVRPFLAPRRSLVVQGFERLPSSAPSDASTAGQCSHGHLRNTVRDAARARSTSRRACRPDEANSGRDRRPRQADPRSNTDITPIAGGPATSPEHVLSIFDRLLVKCWVTPDEHVRLNRAGRSFQWDAPDGDGWSRYRQAAVVAYRLSATGEMSDDRP